MITNSLSRADPYLEKYPDSDLFRSRRAHTVVAFPAVRSGTGSWNLGLTGWMSSLRTNPMTSSPIMIEKGRGVAAGAGDSRRMILKRPWVYGAAQESPEQRAGKRLNHRQLISIEAGEIRTCAYDHTTRGDKLSDHAALLTTIGL
ncbi:MAG: hypothetical protein ABIZ05_12855 [Pseudonocardiaceae bacterium]